MSAVATPMGELSGVLPGANAVADPSPAPAKNSHLRRVLVVGGGIAGMAAAMSFCRRDVGVDLVDLDPEWRTYGAGITITGPTLRALQQLGVLDAVGREGCFSDHVKFFDATGRFLSAMDAPALGPGISGTGGVLRPALHRILAEQTVAVGTRVRLGVTVATWTENSEGVEVNFTDGSVDRYDAVVAADGCHSTSRDRLFPDAPKLEFTGQGCWRLLANRPPDVTSPEIYFGPNSVKVGFNPCSADRMYLFATVAMPGNPHVPDAALVPGMRDILAPFGGRVAAIREQLGAHSSINYRPLFAVLVPPPWNVGRIGLIGDAAHSTTPHLASGAGMSVEDGLILAEELLAVDDVAQGWRNFAARRFERARLVVENSVEIGRLEQEGGRDADVRMLMAVSTKALSETI